MAKKIGVIAEDISDVEVVKEILAKYIDRRSFSVKHFVGQGCGKLRNKCGAWIDTLSKQGCTHIFLFHDLDRSNEKALRKEIQEKIKSCLFQNSLIVIPTEELEAWLLSDMDAIKQVFDIAAPIKQISDVEAVKSPKEHLEKMVRRLSKKVYVNTIHNKKIAAQTTKANLMRCNSFQVLDKYLTAL